MVRGRGRDKEKVSRWAAVGRGEEKMIRVKGAGRERGGEGGAREKGVWSRGRLRDSAGEREGKTLGDESILRTKS